MLKVYGFHHMYHGYIKTFTLIYLLSGCVQQFRQKEPAVCIPYLFSCWYLINDPLSEKWETLKSYHLSFQPCLFPRVYVSQTQKLCVISDVKYLRGISYNFCLVGVVLYAKRQ